jgi:hypothetical protein
VTPNRFLLAVLAGLAACNTCQAAGLFDSDAVLEVALKGPLTAVIRDDEHRGERSFSLELDGVTVPVAVRLRGKSRVEFCSFPPLRLNFASEEARDTIFDGQDKLKLVTHCKGPDEYEQNLLEEVLAYRLVNTLTDISIRTRLLRVTYVNTDKPGAAPITRFGFLIETEKAVADRLGGSPLQIRNLSRKMLDVEHSALVFVFHYLIGNTDWSLVRNFEDDYCCHNSKLVRVGERNYFLPYDFDMSGLVNARYAEPQPELRLRSVRTRRYRGYCTEPAAVRKALRRVVSLRDEIIGEIAEIPGLTPSNRQRQQRYLEKFFTLAAKEDKLLKEFERRCL